METDYNISTKKIQILVNSSDKEEKNAFYGRLRYFADECRRAANLVVNQQHINFNIKERILLYNPDIAYEFNQIDLKLSELDEKYKTTSDKKERAKFKDCKTILFENKKELNLSLRDKEASFYKNSGTVLKTKSGDKIPGNETSNPVRSSTYQLLSLKFPNIPSSILNSLHDNVFKNLKKDLPEVLKGNKTVRTYKSCPIFFMKSAIVNLQFNQEHKEFDFSFCKIPLITNLGRDRSNNQITLERIVSGEYLLCDSSISFKNNKLFLSLVVKTPKEKIINLSNDIFVGVDIGITNPIAITSSKDKWGKFIGNKKFLFDKKHSFQKQKKALQEAISQKKGGKGYNTKMRKLKDIATIETDYTNTLLHTYAKQVIDYTISQGAKIIKMEFMEGISEEESKLKDLVRFWPIRKLQSLIEEKASKVDIHVVYVDPYRTSQTCSACGYYEEGQREKRDFLICKNPICSKSGKKQNADRNASVNICNSDKIVTSKKECQISKLKEKKIQLSQ